MTPVSATSSPRAVVIGSGFGGLALAIRLQAAGLQTTLLEQRDKPGGRAYVYHDQGFTFDAGPTVITAPGVASRTAQIRSTSSWATAAVSRPCLPLLPRKMSAKREDRTTRNP